MNHDSQAVVLAFAVMAVLFMAYVEWRLRSTSPKGPIVPVRAETLTELREQLRQRTEAYTSALDWVKALRKQKHQAYYERNLVIALLARVLMEEALVHPNTPGFLIGTGVDKHFEDWKTCLYIETPAQYELGQLNWHFHDEHAWMVESLGAPPHPFKWDGRTKEQKNSAIEAYLKKLGETDKASLEGD
jgi:hypothetical protein